jgi:hypothetical protein
MSDHLRVGAIEESAAEIAAERFLAVRECPRKVYRLRYWAAAAWALLTAGGADGAVATVPGPGVTVELYRPPQGPVLRSIDYDGDAIRDAADYVALLRRQLESLSLRAFCDEHALDLPVALGRSTSA